MHIISCKRLLEFCQQHADAFTPLDNWFITAKTAKWRNLNDVRQIYPSADAVGNFTVFNIKGNNYRLIVSIDYESQIIFVKYVLTHSEYDEETWKNDPYFDKKAYGALLAEVQPQVITSEEENERYLEIVQRLMACKNRTPEQNALLKLLVILIEDFEEEHYPLQASIIQLEVGSAHPTEE